MKHDLIKASILEAIADGLAVLTSTPEALALTSTACIAGLETMASGIRDAVAQDHHRRDWESEDMYHRIQALEKKVARKKGCP